MSGRMPDGLRALLLVVALVIVGPWVLGFVGWYGSLVFRWWLS
jgi:hypothetical protein